MAREVSYLLHKRNSYNSSIENYKNCFVTNNSELLKPSLEIENQSDTVREMIANILSKANIKPTISE